MASMSRNKLPPPTSPAMRWLYDFKDIDTLKDFKRDLANYRWRLSYGRLKRLFAGSRPTPEEYRHIWRIKKTVAGTTSDPSHPRFKVSKVKEKAFTTTEKKAIKKAENALKIAGWRAKRRMAKKRSGRAARIAEARAEKKKLQKKGEWDRAAWQKLRKKYGWSHISMCVRIGTGGLQRAGCERRS